jgi:hypothetical protein
VSGRIGGVVPLHEVPGSTQVASPRAAAEAGEEVVERTIGSTAVDSSQDAVEGFPQLRPRELPPPRLPVFAGQVARREPCLGEDPLGQRCRAMHELGAQLHGQRQARITNGQDASADAVSRLEHEDRQATAAKLAGCRQARHAGTYNRHVCPLHLVSFPPAAQLRRRYPGGGSRRSPSSRPGSRRSVTK